MCGIAGLVDYQRPLDLVRLEAMQAALWHRGPDDQGTYRDHTVGLAHTRLAILDAAGGAQPMLSPDGRYVLIYNGEVYNHRELRERLDYPFRSHCDTEVVLAACVRRGERAVEDFDGMFSFFFWDKQKREGFGARDRLGITPFVYRYRDGELCFASEVKAILAAMPERPRLHLPSFVEWALMPQFSGVEHTLFEECEVLPPGCILRVRQEGITIERYWDYRFDLDGEEAEEAGLVTDLRRCFVEAVHATATQAEVPVGAFLSGGLDSTAIVAAARPLETFTVRFHDQGGYDYTRSVAINDDDSPYAERAARALGVPQHWVEVDQTQMIPDLARLAQVNDALPALEQEFAQHYLARAASQRVKVILVGDASDETHYGYHFLLDEEVTAAPAGPMLRFGARERVALLNPKLVAALDPMRELPARYEALAAGAGLGWGNAEERRRATTYLVIRRWLARLLHNGDIHALAFSLEARVPFGLNRVLAVSQRVPPRLGFRDGVEKWVLRQAVPEAVPPEIRWRKKSAMPKDQSIGARYQAEVRRILKTDVPVLARYLDVAHLSALAREGRPLREVERSMLFHAISFFHWTRIYGVE